MFLSDHLPTKICILPTVRLLICHKIYTSIISDYKLNPKKLYIYFSKAKLAWYPFATIYYSNVLTFLQINPPFNLIYLQISPKIQTQKKYKKIKINWHKRCSWCLWHWECLPTVWLVCLFGIVFSDYLMIQRNMPRKQKPLLKECPCALS